MDLAFVMAARTRASRAEGPGLEPQTCHLLAVWSRSRSAEPQVGTSTLLHERQHMSSHISMINLRVSSCFHNCAHQPLL